MVPSSRTLRTRDGVALFLADGGQGVEHPGSGLLCLYSMDLEERGTIDVSTPVGGRPNSLVAARLGTGATTPDGRVR